MTEWKDGAHNELHGKEQGGNERFDQWNELFYKLSCTNL